MKLLPLLLKSRTCVSDSFDEERHGDSKITHAGFSLHPWASVCISRRFASILSTLTLPEIGFHNFSASGCDHEQITIAVFEARRKFFSELKRI